jgi:hypothetical protein
MWNVRRSRLQVQQRRLSERTALATMQVAAERARLLRADRTMLHPARMVGPLGNSKSR